MDPAVMAWCAAAVAMTRLDPGTVAVMAEAGVDISGQKSKSLADIKTELLVMLGVVVVGLIVSRLLFRATQGGK